MKFISITEFLKRYFMGVERPTVQTIIRKIREGKIPGGQLGGSGPYYVNAEAYEKMLKEQKESGEKGEQPSKEEKAEEEESV